MRSILLTVGCLFGLATAAAAEQNYKFVTEIPIGGEGGWDISASILHRTDCISRMRQRWWSWTSRKTRSWEKSPTRRACMRSWRCRR